MMELVCCVDPYDITDATRLPAICRQGSTVADPCSQFANGPPRRRLCSPTRLKAKNPLLGEGYPPNDLGTTCRLAADRGGWSGSKYESTDQSLDALSCVHCSVDAFSRPLPILFSPSRISPLRFKHMWTEIRLCMQVSVRRPDACCHVYSWSASRIFMAACNHVGRHT
jgi:hypothetical protein